MCGRYLFFDQNNARIRSLLALLERQLGDEPLSELSLGEVFPSQRTPVCLLSEQGEELVPAAMRWGFTHPTQKRLVINARSETAPRSRMFGESLRQRRCVICASGYYEWEKPSRKKILFTLPDLAMLCMAGFYRLEADGPHFVIMTRPALPELSAIHDRMPVVLNEVGALRYCQGEDRLHCASRLQVRPADRM